MRTGPALVEAAGNEHATGQAVESDVGLPELKVLDPCKHSIEGTETNQSLCQVGQRRTRQQDSVCANADKHENVQFLMLPISVPRKTSVTAQQSEF